MGHKFRYKNNNRVLSWTQVRVKFSSEMESDAADADADDNVGSSNKLDDEVEQLRQKDQVLKEFKVNLDLTK